MFVVFTAGNSTLEEIFSANEPTGANFDGKVVLALNVETTMWPRRNLLAQSQQWKHQNNV